MDDIAAIWLFKIFFPDFKNAKIKFISAEKGSKGLADTKNIVHFGVGRGKYDEHKGDIGKCATSLVWDDIKKSGLSPKDKFELEAYEEMVRWNTLVDTAQMPITEFDQFMVDTFIRSYKNDPKDSLKTVELGAEILDRIMPKLIKKQRGLADWEKRIEFKSRWGKSVAVKSADFDRSFAYAKGFKVVVQLSPTDHFIGITAPGTVDLDLTKIYLILKDLEPDANWYFHHSKKMILCGSKSAPEGKRSKLTFEQLIKIIKST